MLFLFAHYSAPFLPISATDAMNSAANYLKMMYVNQTIYLNKTIHVVSTALKAALIWHKH